LDGQLQQIIDADKRAVLTVLKARHEAAAEAARQEEKAALKREQARARAETKAAEALAELELRFDGQTKQMRADNDAEIRRLQGLISRKRRGWEQELFARCVHQRNLCTGSVGTAADAAWTGSVDNNVK